MKPWYRSKMVWFNLAFLLGSFLTDPNNGLMDLGLSQSQLVAVSAAGNIILRFKTFAEIAFRE